MLDRLDRRSADVAHMRHAVGHPVDMLLDRLDHARQHRRAARPGDGEQIGKADRCDAEIGAGTGAPFLRQRLPVAAGDARSCRTSPSSRQSRSRRRWRRADIRCRHLDAVGREALDRCLRHIDQFHMRQIVGLEIAGIDAETLAAEHVMGAQQLGGGGVLDDAADLVAREFGDGVVGFFLEQQVAKAPRNGSPPRSQASSYCRSRSSGEASSAGFMLNGK